MAQGFSVEIVEPDCLTVTELALWTSIVASDPLFASPYFHPAFTRAVAAVAPDTAVAVLHRRGVVVGFFPFQRRGETIQPIGAPLNDYHGAIARSEDRPSLEQMPDLIGVCSLSVTGWVDGPGAARGIEHQSLIADIPDGWSAYDAQQRLAWRKFFSDKDRARRSLIRDAGEVSLRFEQGRSDGLERLFALKRAQYQRSGRHDIFACGWTEDLLRHLLKPGDDPTFGGTLAVLYAGDDPVAYEYGLFASRHYHFWFPAYELAFARYSPGILLSLDTMRAKADAGYTAFDFAHAGEPYKKYFCNRTGRLFEGAVSRSGVKGALRSAVLTTRLGQSVHRRWKTIAGCETSSVGRLVGLAVAARAMVTPADIAARRSPARPAAHSGRG